MIIFEDKEYSMTILTEFQTIWRIPERLQHQRRLPPLRHLR